MENRKDNLSKASNAANFFYEILHVHYYADEEDDEAEFDMDMKLFHFLPLMVN